MFIKIALIILVLFTLWFWIFYLSFVCVYCPEKMKTLVQFSKWCNPKEPTDKSLLVDSIINSIREEPGKWMRDPWSLKHEGGVELWIANGSAAVGIHSPAKIQFPLYQRHKLWLAYLGHENTTEDDLNKKVMDILLSP